MGLFRKKPQSEVKSSSATTTVVDENNPPPVFYKHDEAQLLKGYNPRRRASIGASIGTGTDGMPSIMPGGGGLVGLSTGVSRRSIAVTDTSHCRTEKQHHHQQKLTQIQELSEISTSVDATVTTKDNNNSAAAATTTTTTTSEEVTAPKSSTTVSTATSTSTATTTTTTVPPEPVPAAATPTPVPAPAPVPVSAPVAPPEAPKIKKLTNANLVIPPFKGAKQSDTSNGNKMSFDEESVSIVLIDSDDEYIEEIIESDDEYTIEEEIIEDPVRTLPPRKITITFDDYDEMRTILHINDYTDSELNKAWYKREDYDKMVQTARKAVDKYNKEMKAAGSAAAPTSSSSSPATPSSSPATPTVDIRGLEAWKDAAAVRVLKERALEAIWNEQNRQWTVGDYNPEKLRNAYLTVSAEAQQTALDRAKEDEMAAEQIRQEDDNEIKKKRRMRMSVAKALGKSMRVSSRAVGKTGRALGRTTLGVATLDGRMIKESLGTSKRKKLQDSEPRIIRQPSLGARKLLDLDNMKLSLSERNDYSDATPHASSELFHSSMPVSFEGTNRLVFDPHETRSLGSKSVASLDSIVEDEEFEGDIITPMMMEEMAAAENNNKNDKKNSTELMPSPSKTKITSRHSLMAMTTSTTATPEAPPQLSALSGKSARHSVIGASPSIVSGVPSLPVSRHSSIIDTPKRKQQKLKLLGLVPIPGTKKMYQEDLERKRIEDRRNKMTRMPSWETGLAAGKF